MNDVVKIDEKLAIVQAGLALLPQIELETHHFFADGMYARVCVFKAGEMAVGRMHGKEHFFLICSGTMEVYGDGETNTITGPAIFVSPAGTKRAVMAVTDVVCLTLHRTSSRDLDEIEKECMISEPGCLFDSGNKLKPKELT